MSNIKSLIDGLRKLHNYEIWFALLLFYSFCGTLFFVFSGVLCKFPLFTGLAEVLFIIMGLIIILFSLPYFRLHLRKTDICFYLVILLFYLAQFIIHPSNDPFLSEYFVKVMLYTVPMYFVGVTMDVRKFEIFLYWLSLIGILWLFYYYNIRHFEAEELELQGPSYEMLFLLVVVTWHLFKRFDVIGFVVILVGIYSLLTFAARGPFLFYFLFVVLYFLFFYFKTRKLFVISIASAIVFLLYYYYDLITISLGLYLGLNGYNTRIVDSLLMGDFSDASSQDRLYLIEVLQRQLNSGDSLSYGLFGSWNYIENYAHRLYWDLWFNFGYFVGTVLMVILLLVLIRGLKAIDNSVEKGFWLALLCCGFLPLFVSGYYLFNIFFFLFIGYNIQMIRKSEDQILFKK